MCPACGRPLRAEQAQGPQITQRDSAGEEPPPETPATSEGSEKPDTADQQLTAATLEAGGLPERPPTEEDGDTADDFPGDKTLQPPSHHEVPPDIAGVLPEDEDEADMKRPEPRRVEGTILADGTPLSPGDTPPPAEDHVGDSDEGHFAETVDSEEVPSDVAEKISAFWSATLHSDANPLSSIKGKFRAVVAESRLIIPSRLLREQDEPPVANADYELLGKLGKGGMGIVYAARQASVDRTVAVKMLHSRRASDKEQREAFLAEAVVTGDLEHPNIVPIYDLGISVKGALFYSMKRVKGTPWSEVISEKSIPDNLDILIKVSDAMAFAHSRGVVHRDLKPENIMLGDFGEVLLMDWGLAMSRALKGGPGVAGTPAYMAPEMARGPIDRIGFHSDIYLLGAILYEMIAGKPPHAGKDVRQCLLAAAKNEIPLPTEDASVSSISGQTGELLSIAMKAMATAPRERYAGVGEFQDAIRQYQAHSESISLATRAREDLQEARGTEDYKAYARAMFGFQEALELWEGNKEAQSGASGASLAYAGSALKKGDYDLGISLLNVASVPCYGPEHIELSERLRTAARERDTRQRRLKNAKRIAVALVATILVIVTGSFFWIRAEANRAQAAEVVAKKARSSAEEARATAETNEDLAVAAQKREEEQRKIAEENEVKAVAAQKQEVYRAYITRIGLVAANVRQNAFDRAQSLLDECPEELRNWEWHRLKHLCTQVAMEVDTGQPIEAVAFSPDGKHFATGGWGGVVYLCSTESDGDQGPAVSPVQIETGAEYVFALAFSPDGKQIAIGTNDSPDYLKIWDSQTGKLRQLLGHADAVLSVVYSRDGRKLLTSSYDNTAKLWDLEDLLQGKPRIERDFRGHDRWVWSAAFSPDEKRIVTASQDGYVIVWSVESGKPEHTFLGHLGPVYAAAFSPDGKQVASAGYDKRVLLWDPDKVAPLDDVVRDSVLRAVRVAVDRSRENQPNGRGADRVQDGPVTYAGKPLAGEENRSPVYTALEGHTAAVRSVQFSPDVLPGGGGLLISGGNDNTVRIWSAENGQLLKTLRGHGSWVLGCLFAPDFSLDHAEVLSVSYDHRARIWNLDDYEEFRVFGERVLRWHKNAVLGASFSPDGQQIVSASRDRTARIWDLRPLRGVLPGEGKQDEKIVLKEGHEFLTSAAVFFPDGKQVLTAAVDNTARIWSMRTGTEVAVLRGTGPSAAVALSHDAQWILTGSDGKTAKIFDANVLPGGEVKLLRELTGHNAEVTAVAISADDQFLLTGDRAGVCRLWNAKTYETLWESWESWESAGHSRGITSAVFLREGDRVLTASTDHTVAQWDVKTGRERTDLILKHPAVVTALALSPTRRWAVTACADKVVRFWDVDSGRQTGQLSPGSEMAPGEMTNHVAFSADGRQLLTTSSPDTVRRWQVPEGQEIRELTAANVLPMDEGPFLSLSSNKAESPGSGGELVWSAIFSPAGDVLTVGGNEALLWDGRTACQLLRFTPQDPVASAHFSPTEDLIVTGSLESGVRIWDITKKKAVLKLEGEHKGFVNQAVFSPDGSQVLTASDDNTAKLWDAKTGSVLRQFAGHADRVRGAVFSPDGTRVLTVSDDKTARIWSSATGQQLCRLDRHRQAVLSAAFSADGKWVITGSEDNTARIWDATTGKPINPVTGEETDFALAGHSAGVTSVAFSPDGKRAITGSRDNTAKVWELRGGEELLTLERHTEEVTCVTFSPNGKSILTGSRDGTLVLWPTEKSPWREPSGQ